jgi:two-component system OmpR family response regulator
MRILLVEDDHVLGALVCDALEQSGHETERVPTTESAIGALVGRRFDVLLLDLDLGATRGEGLVHRMRALGESLPPIVIVSGQPPEVIAAATVATNAAAVLRKPYTIDELLVAVVAAQSPKS